MPKLNKRRVDPQPHGRYKSFVSRPAGILFNGVYAFVNHKKQSALQKDMKKLLARQKITEGRTTAIGIQMASIFQTLLKEIETDIVESNKRLEMLTQHVILMKLIKDKFILEVSDNVNVIKFLAFIYSRIAVNVERNFLKYQQLLAGLDHLVGRLHTSSSGLLSHTIIPPGKLAKLLDHVKSN